MQQWQRTPLWGSMQCTLAEIYCASCCTALGTAAWQSMHMLEDLAVHCSTGFPTANPTLLLTDLPRLTRLTSLTLHGFSQVRQPAVACEEF